MLTGQTSYAIRSESFLKEIFAKPPRFKQKSNPLNSSSSPIGTKGAPCPPRATSSDRKSAIVVISAIAAIAAPFPICSVSPMSG